MSIASKSRNLCDIFTRIVKIGKFIARAANAAGNTAETTGIFTFWASDGKMHLANLFTARQTDRLAGRQAAHH